MEYFKIIGSRRLEGEISLHGAKNSVLPILSASVLINGESVIHNCPRLSDVENTVKILEYLGAEVKWENDTLIINSRSVNKYDIPVRLMREMRSSILFLGSLLSRQKRASLSFPGGCEIGLRPIDIHLNAIKELGYRVEVNSDSIDCFAEKSNGANTFLPFPSVGATENVILASVVSEGTVRIINAAREPEIEDLCNYLNSAGADIRGAGSTVIEINGVSKLHSVEHAVIPDRILASTLMSAAAVTGGNIRINNVKLSHLEPILGAFIESGCKLWTGEGELVIKAPERLKRVKRIQTRPYPGFPTDSQATCTAMLTAAKGVSTVYETIFENRFRHIPQLLKFGADITVCERTAVISGVKSLKPAEAYCTDLRGGAAVAVVALKAQGVSIIKNIYHIDRGYEKFEEQLNQLGAAIMRKNDEEEKQGKQKKDFSEK